jgi:hypothetical protein
MSGAVLPSEKNPDCAELVIGRRFRANALAPTRRLHLGYLLHRNLNLPQRPGSAWQPCHFIN